MITPKDIENKMFKVSFRGYNTEEVDDFLQEICDSYLEIYIENKKLREQILVARDETRPIAYTKVADREVEREKEAEEALKEAKCAIEKAENASRDVVDKISKKLDENAQKLLDMHSELLAYKKEVTSYLASKDDVVTEKLTPSCEDTERIPCTEPGVDTK